MSSSQTSSPTQRPNPPPPFQAKDWKSFLGKHPLAQQNSILHSTVLKALEQKSPSECFELISSDKFLSILVRAPPPGKEFTVLHSFFKIGGSIRTPQVKYYALQGFSSKAHAVEIDPLQIFKSSDAYLPAKRDLSGFSPTNSISSIQASQKSSKIMNAIPLPPFFINTFASVDPSSISATVDSLHARFNAIDNDIKSRPNSNIQPSTDSKVALYGFIWAFETDLINAAHYRTARVTQEVEAHVKNLHLLNIHNPSITHHSTPTSSATTPANFMSPELSSINKNLEALVQNSTLSYQSSNKSPTEKIKNRLSSIAFDQILLASKPNSTTDVSSPCQTMIEFLSCKNEAQARIYLNQMLVSRSQASIYIPRGNVTAFYQANFTWTSAAEVKNFTLFSLPPYEEGIELLSKENQHDRILELKRSQGSEEYSQQDIQELLKQQIFLPKNVDGLIQHISNGALVSSFLFGKTSFLCSSIQDCLQQVKSNRVTFVQYHNQDPLFLSKFLFAIDRRIYNFLVGCECGKFIPNNLLFSATVESITHHSNFSGSLPLSISRKRLSNDKDKDKDKDKQNEGKKIKNPHPVEKWIHPEHHEFTKLHQNQKACPKLNNEMICARYHCKGNCFSDCRRKITHKQIDPNSTEGKAFTKWVEDSLKN